MDAGGADAPTAPALGPAPRGSAAHPQRAAGCGQSRVPVKTAAQRVPGVADGLPCLPQMDAGAHRGGAQRPAPGLGAGPDRQTPEAHRGHPGQPGREIRPARRGPRPRRCQEDQRAWRHLRVDTLGLWLGGHVTPALLARVLPGSAWLRLLWVDGGHTSRAFAAWIHDLRPKLAVTVVKRSDKANGFTVLARRWVVERTFGRLMRLPPALKPSSSSP